MTDRILTRQGIILLHLLQYIDVEPSGYTMPYAMTQDGIGAAAGMSRAHVSNEIGILEDKGMVAWIGTHPKGATARKRAYYLLPQGRERAMAVSSRLEEMSIALDDVIHRPGGRGNSSPNVIRAMMEIEKARNAVAALRSEGDPAKIKVAIGHASVAINFLSREVM